MAATLSERGFKGLITNISPHDVPPGAALAQNNMLVVAPGVLRCRRGVVPLPWSLTPADSEAVIAMFRYDTQAQSFLVYQRADGTIKAAYNGGFAQLSSAGDPYSGFRAGYPFSCVRTRQGNLLMFNGIDRPVIWDGIGYLYYAGIDPPAAITSVTLSSGGGLSAGAYQWAYRYLDANGLPSELSPATAETATAGQSASVVVPASSQPGGPGIGPYSIFGGSDRAQTTELWRTTVAETTTYYRVATYAGNGNTFTDDTTDATLLTNALANNAMALPVTNPDGSLNAYRQGLPPCDKPYVTVFQNRCFAYGTTTYSQGTVTFNNTGTVTGSGTSWPYLSYSGAAQPLVGRYMQIGDSNILYQITAVASATSLTVTPAVSLAGGGFTYTILPPISDVRALYYTSPDEPESWSPLYVVGIQNNTLDNDAETGAMPFNSMLYLLHERHIYQATYIEQGTIIITAQCITNRGCLNNRCWVIAGDTAFLMDQYGIYAFTGGQPEPISDPIQDLWINGTLDWTKQQFWYASYEPTERVVRFHVHYVGDSGDQPTRALTFVPATRSWSTDTYPMGLGAACRTDVSGVNRLVYGGTADNLLLASQGLSDVVTAAIVGTVTLGGSSTTIADSTASFTSAAIGAPVAIVRGFAKGQVGIVTGKTGTTLTVSGLTVAPAVGDTYAVGAIQYDYQTGRHAFADSSQVRDVMVNRSAILCHASTTNPATMDVRRYINHNTTPEFWQPGSKRHLGVSYDQNGPNAVVNLLASQFPSGVDPGYKEVDNPGAVGGPLAARWAGFELTGFQTLDAILIYGLDLTGIQP